MMWHETKKEQTIMKKIIALLLAAVILAVTLTACGENEQNSA